MILLSWATLPSVLKNILKNNLESPFKNDLNEFMGFCTGRMLKLLINEDFIYSYSDSCGDTCPQLNQLIEWCDTYGEQLSKGTLDDDAMEELYYIDYEAALKSQYKVKKLDNDHMNIYYKHATYNLNSIHVNNTNVNNNSKHLVV